MRNALPSSFEPDELLALRQQLVELQQQWEVQRAEVQHLRDQLHMFRQALDVIPDMILIKGPQSRIVYGNRSFCELCGVSQQQLLGLSDAPSHPWDRPEQRARDDAHVFHSGQTLHIPHERVTGHDGVVRSVQTTKAALRDRASNIAWIVAILRDTTDKVATEPPGSPSADEQAARRTPTAARAKLSLPLIPITADVMVMPLVGLVDAALAHQVLETLLAGTAHHRARVVILDLTGVPVVDALVGNLLVQASWALQLLGARVVLTGIRPEVARTLTDQQIDLSEVVTQSSLQSGIAFALGKMPGPPQLDPTH